LKGREGFGFLSPSRRACEAVFGAFEKIKYIFSIAQVESLEKSQECFSLEKHSPNAGLRGTGHCTYVSGALSFSGRGEGSTGRSASGGGQTQLVRLVWYDVNQ